MAVGRINLTAEIEGLRQLRYQLGNFLPNEEKAKILGQAIEKAAWPVFRRLYETTPIGPTGNLNRARDYKIIEYPLDGTAVGIVGFRGAGSGAARSAQGGTVRQGPDRAFHQWWLEYGTQPRRVADTFSSTPYARRSHRRVTRSGAVAEVREHQVKGQGGYIASSFNRLGPFGILPATRPPRGQNQRVQTEPGYPKAFFKKSKTPITIPPMPVGGSTGEPPLATAWASEQSTVAAILSRELRISIEAALNSLAQSTGTIA